MKDYSRALTLIGGYCLLVAGLVSAAALCFHPDEFVPGSVLLASWTPVHLSLLFAFAISVFGVIGLFSALQEKAGTLGIIAYTLGILGCVGSAAVVVIEVFVLPVVAMQSAQQVPLMDMMGPATPLSLLGKFFMSSIMVWILAWVLIGVVLIRNNLFPRYLGIIVISASICIAVPTHFAGGLSALLHIAFSILFGVSWMLLGNALIKMPAD